MSKQNTPIKFVEHTDNGKLVGKKKKGVKRQPKKYSAATTYSPVGGTCPTTCWFHPSSDFKSQWPKGWQPCYADVGHTRFSTRPEAFEGAAFDSTGLAIVRHRINMMLESHIVGDDIVDLFRWHTGGDILHPDTGEIWVEHVDLILEMAPKLSAAGIPLIGYTAAWRLDAAQPLKHLFLASVQTFEDAALAISMGWQVALAVLESQYEEAIAFLRSLGVTVVGCPEQHGKAASCAECGWCATIDPTKIHEHKYAKYMRFRKLLKMTGLPGSTVFIVHR
jgi:hypothetical protein